MFIGCQNYTKIHINHASFLVTTLLPSCLSICNIHSQTVKYHVIKYSEPDFSNRNVNYFGPSKTLLRSSKSSGCEIFSALKYLLSIFLLRTHYDHMLLSEQNRCLLLNGVSTESQKRTSVRQISQDFSPTRNMPRIYVGLVLSYVKLLLSSWTIFMCNLMACYANK